MGLLDQVIGGVLGQVLGGGRHEQGGAQGGGSGGGMSNLSPIVQALLMLLMSKGAGGLGDLLGGGAHRKPQGRREPEHTGDDGDLGGFGQDRGEARDRDAGSEPRGRQSGDQGGDFGDLAGMLDGPGDRGGGRDERAPGAGPYARLDHEAGDGQTGLDGLIDRFQRGGLGEMMESWIGHGENRPVQPRQLADALGPETVDTLAQRTGLQRDDLLSQLAQALPQVIDRLTPQGRRPTGDDARGW
ncbi:YidB family protein [Methylobacterium sp. J-090]|uniref:YidB family protein n=1 Tax=Methylobacterium sp. J-090 TaxID=2836666 RepID=UPI001FB8E5EC|nr:YidB family protein [Methylobacterium sp. J-090]MCJ2082109.1 YidB family protein [Methylobacterium sp. J-090]